MNDGVIQRKHVGSHRREPPALRSRLRRKGNAQMRQERGRKRKGNAQMRKGNAQRKRGNGPMKRLNVRQKKHVDV